MFFTDKISRNYLQIACMRAPDGEMIGLFEGQIMESSEEGNFSYFFIGFLLMIFTEGGDVMEAKDKTTEEIKNILRKIQF